MRFINAGFGNLLAVERIVSAASPDSAPIRRLAQEAKENGAAVDLACGRKCRSVIVCDSGHIVLSALTVEALGARLAGAEKSGETAEDGAGDGEGEHTGDGNDDGRK